MADPNVMKRAPFTYERVKEHTGKVQYRVNGAAAVTVAGKRVTRGEVIASDQPNFTNGLVRTGNFAHVPADTTVGPLSTETPDADPRLFDPLNPPAIVTDNSPFDAPAVEAPLSVRLREWHRDAGPSLTPDLDRRLLELTDGAEAGEKVPHDSPLWPDTAALLKSAEDEFTLIRGMHATSKAAAEKEE